MQEVILPILVFSIPIVLIVMRNLTRWRVLDQEILRQQAEFSRRFGAFDQLEDRVARMERHVTSPEFDLNRKLRQLAGE
ncbi:MAG: hypothetical protein PW843_21595 [Azospirillaceae bacterium]|nr:hypothetical protein [Azospirillaceae bacterium]